MKKEPFPIVSDIQVQKILFDEYFLTLKTDFLTWVVGGHNVPI